MHSSRPFGRVECLFHGHAGRKSRLAVTRLSYAIGVLLIGLSNANAMSQSEISDEERGLLPRWCDFTQGFDRAPDAPGHYASYVQRFGEGWTHLHHFCWAMVNLQRYQRFDAGPQRKKGLAVAVIGDLDYVLREAPEDFVLLFDVYLRKAKLLLLEGELEAARRVSDLMVEKWPERADAHGLAAQVLIDSGRRAEAGRLLDRSVQQVIDKDRLRQIRSVLKL